MPSSFSKSLADRRVSGFGCAQIVDVGAGLALRLVLDQRPLERPRMHAVDRPPAWRCGWAPRSPWRRPTEAPQSWRDEPNGRSGESCSPSAEDVAHQVLDAVGLHTLGLGGARVAALVGRHGMERAREGRQHLVPGARVFRKAVQEQDERRAGIAHGAHMQVDAVHPHRSVCRMGRAPRSCATLRVPKRRGRVEAWVPPCDKRIPLRGAGPGAIGRPGRGREHARGSPHAEDQGQPAPSSRWTAMR